MPIPKFMYTDPELMRKNIRFLRRRKKMSKIDFARYTEIRLTFLECVEYGMGDHIDLKALENLSEIFGIAEEEIVKEDLEKKYAGKRFRYSK